MFSWENDPFTGLEGSQLPHEPSENRPEGRKTEEAGESTSQMAQPPHGETDGQANAAPEPLVPRPPKSADRRAKEFLPQWLKRLGRAYPG